MDWGLDCNPYLYVLMIVRCNHVPVGTHVCMLQSCTSVCDYVHAATMYWYVCNLVPRYVCVNDAIMYHSVCDCVHTALFVYQLNHVLVRMSVCVHAAIMY